MNRARTIVRLAADTTKTPFAKAWLRDDPHGKWEQRADRLLQQASEHPAFPSMGDDKVNREVATVLSYLVLEALLRDKKRSRGSR